ncbi:MAG: hypothetical protein CMM48_12030 [Rhodospirillaceae bacterium]|nr:hypothetical protein [Rhodospirillaceae bacterium]MBL24614.1 hypothetical protein [Rhodospirillaceae bacterium]HAA91174.1 hypothetical protein [Rhodospirillaceae bacterium]|tara:strand:- start:68 stop:1183 length:1116 start_codon:yes stop_codon:yes gene_type:complete
MRFLAILVVLTPFLAACKTSTIGSAPMNTGAPNEQLRLTDSARDLFGQYLRQNYTRAFAVNKTGKIGIEANCGKNKQCGKTSEEQAQVLRQQCRTTFRKIGCKFLAVGDQVVWQGTIVNAPGELIGTDPRFTEVELPKEWRQFDDKLKSMTIGSSHENHFTFDGHKVPLPQGQWILVATDNRISRSAKHDIDYGLSQQAMLAQIHKGKVDRLLYVFTSVNRLLATKRKRDYRTCNKKRNFSSVNVVNNKVNQDCYYTYIADIFTKGKTRLILRAKDYFKTNNLALPSLFAATGYRFGNRSDWLTLRIYKNLESDGFVIPVSRKRAAIAWNKNTVAEDEEKSAYMRRIADWAKKWHPKFRAAFGKPIPGSTS